MTVNIQTFKTTHGTDQYVMLGADELASVTTEYAQRLRSQGNFGGWAGDTFESFSKKVVTGDTALVEASDRFLASLEDQIPVSRGWRVVEDVVGSVPNVPVMIAGVPQHMRRRVRTQKENAPLAIYMDLTSSGGIDVEQVTRRGTVLLALVRLLVEHRPVELWVGASLGSHGKSCTVAWRIDTAPLDLARAAYHVGATGMSRGFGYGMCHVAMHAAGNWPFGSYELHCRTAKDRLAAVLPGQEVMYVPPIFLTDPMTTDPVGWIKRVLNITEE